MRTFRFRFRFLSLVGALGAGSVVLGACDASPYAASVNGHVISVNSLNHELAAFSSNAQFVQGFNASNSSSQGGDGTTVAGTGGHGTYSSSFVAQVIGALISTDAVHQHLVAAGTLPTQDEMVASTAVNEYLRSAYWQQFPEGVKHFFIETLADQAVLTPVPSDTSNLLTPYQDIQPFLFSKVCVSQASAFSSSQAQQIIASKTVTGAVVCYDQSQLEAQPPAFQSAVRNLVNVGDISSAIKTSYGYQVLQLTRRDTPGPSAGVQRVIVAAEQPPRAVNGIVAKAHVKVNPQYGTWSRGQVTPPQLSRS